MKMDGRKRTYVLSPTQQEETFLNGSAEKEPFSETFTGGADINENKKQKKQTFLVKWRQILYDYSQYTTFHGLVNVTQPQPFWIRRLIWLLLFLGGCVLFGFQVVTSIVYFLSWPVAVDVKINYNDTIVFPAVTICNQNAFKTTEAYEREQYYLINDLFSGDGVKGHNTSGITLEDLYLSNGHALSDLLVSCTWNGIDCNYTGNFVPTLTDFGLCYTFNSGRNGQKLFHASQTGSEGGLRLQLNIEQYEYMRGPNPGAGLKLQIHNQDDVPLVKDHGLAVPPGSHGFVAIKTVEVNNLKYPHGKCNDSVELDYFSTYTISSCYMDCKEHFLIHTCHCRDIYMAHDPFHKSPICSVDAYEECMLPALEAFHNVQDTCDCPIPCHRRMYDPTVSYASTSNFDIDGLLRHKNTVILQEKYIKARETQQRVNEGVIAEDSHLIQALNETVTSLSGAFSKLSKTLTAAELTLHELHEDLDQRIAYHLDRGLEGVQYAIEHDFIRGWIVFEERAFDYVTSDFFDVATSVKRTFANYSDDISNNTESLKLLAAPIRNLLDGRLELLIRTEEYIEETSVAFRTGDPLLTYQYTIDRRYDMSYINLDIIQSGIEEEYTALTNLHKGMNWFKDGLTMLKQVTDQFVDTGLFNSTLYDEGERLFYQGCRQINYRLYMYKTRVVEKPLEVILERIETFKRANRTLDASFTTVKRKINECKILLFNTCERLIEDISEVSQRSTEYLSNQTNLKSPLCITTAQMDDTVRLLTVAFNELRTAMRSLGESLYELKQSCTAVWTNMLNEVSTKEPYEMFHNDTVTFLANDNEYQFFITVFAYMLRMPKTTLRTYNKSDIIQMVNGDFHVTILDDKIAELETIFSEIARDLDVARTIGEKDEQLLSSFEHLRSSFREFLQRNEIDFNFYRENFMRLDVFMQELSYEEITQQKAYDVARLLSDIGGSMGLFIGGSVLSMFEFVDMFIHQGARMALNR